MLLVTLPTPNNSSFPVVKVVTFHTAAEKEREAMVSGDGWGVGGLWGVLKSKRGGVCN